MDKNIASNITEKTIETYLVKQCKKHNVLCYKFLSTQSGVPDRILIGQNKHGNSFTIFAEIKRPGGKIRDLQKNQMANIRSHGGYTVVLDSHKTIDTLMETVFG